MKFKILVLSLLIPGVAFATPRDDFFALIQDPSEPLAVQVDSNTYGTQALRLLDDIAINTAGGGGGGGSTDLTGINGVAPSVGAGATDTGTLRVTANAGTNLNTSALALEATQVKIPITPGTALGANAGPMVQGSVTTSAPTYTTGQINPLSLTTAGALRVDASASTQPISGTVTANAGTNLNTSALALESGGNLASVKTNTDNLNLTIASTTSGQKGNLNFGAVTTAAPAYTTAQSNPLSLTTTGGLRIDLNSIIGNTLQTNTGSSGTGVPRVVLAADSPSMITEDAASANLNSLTAIGIVRRDTPVANANVGADGDYTNGITDNFGRLWTAAVNVPVADSVAGLTQSKTISAATTNATSVKATAGNLYNIEVFNNGTAARYLKFSNLGSAPTCGTTAVVKTIMVPPGGGAIVNSVSGIYFSTGIAFCITANLVDNDTTVVAANEVVVNLDYK